MAEQQLGTLFVGRDRELQELLSGLGDAASGRGSLFLLGGEPGIGKSRLADELATRARELHFTVLWGRGWEDAGAPAYWPWVQALRAYLRGAESSLVRAQMGSGASDIAQMLPELRDLFADLPPLPETESESARFQLFDSTTTFLRNAGRAAPVLVVLDDLQAADMPSILLLRFLASQLGEMRMVVVGTYRDIALTRDHPLRSAIGELAREPITRVLTLTGLQADAVGEFIEATAGLAPQPHVVSAVWRETKGNPLFVGEAVRLLAAEGRINEVAGLPSLRVAVPAGVRDVIARRIGLLSDASARALTIGAALGPEFGMDVLAKVADFEGDEPLDLIDDAVEAGLLHPVAGALGRYRFSHDLVRETLYDEVPPGRRVRLHRKIAEALEELHGESLETHLAELALHFIEAAQGGDRSTTGVADPARAKAVDYARRAGEQAARSLAYEEATRLNRMALAVLDLDDAPDIETRTEILLAIGDAEARAGAVPAARRTFEEAAALARRSGNVGHLARAALGVGGRFPWLRAGRNTQLIPLLQDALVLLGGSDDRLRVRLLARLACAGRSLPGLREQAAALSQQAVELARRLDDPATLSYAMAGRYWATWWPENPHDRLPLSEEMLAVAEAAGDAERVIDAQLMLHMAYVELGRISEGRTAIEDVRRLVQDLRQPAQMWLGVAPVAEIALLEGDFASAAALNEHEWQAAREPFTPARDETSAATMHLFRLCAEQGRPQDAEAAVRSAVDEFPWYPLHRAALCLVLLDLGRADEARVVFGELARDEFAALYPDSEWLLGICMTSEACSELADGKAAGVVYEQLLPFAGRHAIGQAEGSVGAVDRYLGMLAATIGKPNDAERHLTEAIRVNEQMGAHPWTAHSQFDLAGVLLQRDGPGDRERAAELRRAALETAVRLGMVALERRIVAEGTGAAPPAPASPTGVGTFKMEGDYWTVGFEGETIRIRDAKGMRYLARLLAEPGRECHALDLAQMDGMPGSQAGPDPDLKADGLGDAGARLDSEAKAAYRHRLEELREELAEAESLSDPERAARARAEMDALADELAAAVGLGGRDRKAASASERARVSVTRAIRAALGRISDQDPALGRHLEATIRTGAYCSYHPDPRAEMRWEL